MPTFCNQRTPLFDFEWDDTRVVKKITKRHGHNELYPFKFLGADDDKLVRVLNKWLKNREIPEDRENLKLLRENFRNFEKCQRNYLSLTDQYWVKLSNKDNWEKLNYFTNNFSEQIANMSFYPWKVDANKYTQSPDLTLGGKLIKCWRREGDKTFLYKAGSEKFHQEPLSEVLASMTLAKYTSVVEYKLVIHGHRFCSKCANFVDENHEFLPANDVISAFKREDGKSEYEHFMSICDKLYSNNLSVITQEDAIKFIDELLCADFVIGNADRHYNNFGFLRSALTGKIEKFAPLFDFGLSYLTDAEKPKRNKESAFASEQNRIISDAIKSGKLNALICGNKQINLISQYPEITQSKKDAIKKMIASVNREIEKKEIQAEVESLDDFEL